MLLQQEVSHFVSPGAHSVDRGGDATYGYSHLWCGLRTPVLMSIETEQLYSSIYDKKFLSFTLGVVNQPLQSLRRPLDFIIFYLHGF